MATGKALNGKPYAGNPHVRFDEGEVASAAMPRRGSLLYKTTGVRLATVLALTAGAVLSVSALTGFDPDYDVARERAKASGVKIKVTGVAVVDDTHEGTRGAKFLPPETRVVVPSAKQLALFRVEYDVPTNMNVRIWLAQNCTHCGTGGHFGSSPSGLYSGTGTVYRILHLGDDSHDRHVHLKSVRLSVTLEAGKGKNVFIGDAPVNVVYASGELKDGDKFDVLEPLPPPPAVTATLLPGWTEDFEAAKTRAKEEGKLVLAYFLNSRPNKEGKATGVLDHEVLGSKEFLKRAGKSFVLYMCELDDTKQSWAAHGNANIALKYAARRQAFRPPEVAVVDSDGRRVALLDKGGWDGGVEGFLAKIEKALKAGEEKLKAERRARAEALKRVPPKTGGTSTPAGFTDNLDEALAKAKAEGKLVYACFSGSDWCHWCKKLEKEVLSDPLFVAGVMDDYVLVFIDSPQNKAVLSDHAKAENEKLTKKYGIRGFPTALILDGDGKKVDKTGYRQGGAAEYVKHLMEIKKGLKK